MTLFCKRFALGVFYFKGVFIKQVSPQRMKIKGEDFSSFCLPSSSSYFRRVFKMQTGSDGLPRQQGLYHPKFEHDACGVGFVVNIKGEKSHTIIRQALTILKNLSHRGAQGSEANSGDGAGILMQLPHAFFRRVCAETGF
jgi:hypothetical protein